MMNEHILIYLLYISVNYIYFSTTGQIHTLVHLYWNGVLPAQPDRLKPNPGNMELTAFLNGSYIICI